jgi:hypothetical protein
MSPERKEEPVEPRPGERRRYFRVQDEAALTCRVLTPAERDALAAALAQGQPARFSLAGRFLATTRALEPLLRRIRTGDQDLGSYLQALNDKLDLLARAVSLECDTITEAPGTAVQLGAGGVAFPWAHRLDLGTPVELRLLLYPDLYYIVAAGEVVRCDPDGEAGPWQVAVSFTHLHDEDRDLLIRHVLRREAAQLRDARSTAQPS